MATYFEESLKEERKSPLYSIEPLQGSNYREWALAMTMVLRQRGLAAFIDPKPPEIDDTWDAEKKEKFLARKDAALATIFLGVHPGHRGLLEGETDPRVAWIALRDVFEPPSRAHIAALRNEYMAIRYKEEEGMALFISRVENAVRRLKSAGKAVEDSEVAYHLISHLPSDYESVVNTVYLWTDEDFTTAKVKSALLAQYGRLREQDLVQGAQGSSVFTTSRSSSGAHRNRRAARSQGADTRRCYECHQKGHFARQCPSNTSTQTQGAGRSRIAQTAGQSRGGRRRTYTEVPPTTTLTTGSGFCGFYVAAYLGTAKKVPNVFDFTLDTASTHHIVPSRELFEEYKELDGGKVRFGTQDLVAEGMGVVKVHVLETGKLLRLENVLHVPKLDRPLISWRRLDKRGYVGEMSKGEIEVTTKAGEAIFTARLQNDFYVFGVRSQQLDGPMQPVGVTSSCTYAVSQEAAKKTDPSSIMAWHTRLAHANCRTINEMSKKQLVRGLGVSTTEIHDCDACISAKNTRATHAPIGKVTTKDVLELVHTDVWGPAPVNSFGGGRYFISFIDDFSREAVVYIMKNKSDAYASFVDYVTRSERFTGKQCKRLRSDNGMEYCNERFSRELAKRGIKHERTNTYSPQMNGVAERFNRTALESIRAVLAETGLPTQLWGELLVATTYVRNRVMHTTTGETPVSRWMGNVPSVRHLKRLGCIAYVHQGKQYRNKFQPRVRKGVLVGYALNTKGYRIWYPNEDKIVETLHVSFNELKRGLEETKKIEDESRLPPSVWHDSFQSVLDEEAYWSNEQEKTKPITPPAQESSAEYSATSAKPTWRREIVERRTGTRKDVYYYPTTGERLRSAREVKGYCEKHQLTYNDQDFDWSTKNVNGTRKAYEKRQNENEDDLPDASIEEPQAYRAEFHIPTSFEEAQSSDQANEWKMAMDEELETMVERNAWQEVRQPGDTRAFGTKWVYTVKRDDRGDIQRYKARLVALGHHQKPGIDYEDIYSPVVNFAVIRLFFILLVTILGWKAVQLDVKCAYLYGKIDGEVFLRLPKGYLPKDGKTTHLKLNKALYGLHQSGRLWYEELHTKFIEAGFTIFKSTKCVYAWKEEVLILIYVDDMVLMAKTERDLQIVLILIESMFDVKKLGQVSTFLGVVFTRGAQTLVMNQKHYIEECAAKYGEHIGKKTSIPLHPGGVPSRKDCPTEDVQGGCDKPYRELLGSLSFIAQRTRPDITFALNVMSQFTNNPGIPHWNALQEVLRYVFHTRELSMEYSPSNQRKGLEVYVDADWGACVDDRKSVTGYVIYLCGQLLSWRTIKQKCISMSSMEAEYVALSEAAKEVVWLKRIIVECKSLGITVDTPIIYSDSQAAIAFSKSDIENQRTRHIDLRYHYVKDLVQRGEVEVKYVSSKLNTADMMTKALPRSRYELLREDIIPKKSQDQTPD